MYVKEVRTKQKCVYLNAEITHDIPSFISDIIPDAIKLTGDGYIEYVSKKAIVSIEMYLGEDDK